MINFEEIKKEITEQEYGGLLLKWLDDNFMEYVPKFPEFGKMSLMEYAMLWDFINSGELPYHQVAEKWAETAISLRLIFISNFNRKLGENGISIIESEPPQRESALSEEDIETLNSMMKDKVE